MPPRAPAFTCVVTLIDASLELLAVWIYGRTATRFDVTFDLHFVHPL